MTADARALLGDLAPARRLALAGAGIAAVAAGVGLALRSVPVGAIAAVNLGCLGILVAGFGIVRRPKDSLTLLTGSATAILASFATHPEWDSIRLMQWVMAGIAFVASVLVLLPRTYQRIAVSLFVLYHFGGIMSAITSPDPMPWMTAQLWARVFRPHLEFSYVNNAYQFYSPQPGPAEILWFCVYDDQDRRRWLKLPRRDETLDPLAVEYFRRLSLTERANQNVPAPLGPPRDAYQLRLLFAAQYPLIPTLLPAAQFRMPNGHGRQLIAGYARHVITQEYLGRDFGPAVKAKVYLTQHLMLNQKQFAEGENPYAPDTYLPFYVGEFDADGHILEPNDPLLYWVVPIIRLPNNQFENYVTRHAGSDPFQDPQDHGSSPRR